MIKVSIILPVYNVSEYLYQSLSCLVNQTMKEVEIICVDDGSSDNSVEIINNFISTDNRVKLVMNKHSFAGGARNAGLKIAQGKYVMFLDPDDYYDVTMIESLYKKIEHDQSDMLICGVYIINEHQINYARPSYKAYINPFYDNKVFTIDDIGDDIWFFMVYPYNKIYKKDFLDKNNIKFQEIANTNDASFAFEAFIAADNISLTNEMFYYYRAFRSGNTRLTKGRNLNFVIEAYEHSYEVCKKYPNFKKVENGFKAIIISSLIHHLHSYCRQFDLSKTFYYDYVREKIKTDFKNNPDVQNILKNFNCYQYMSAFLIYDNDYKNYVKIINNREKFLKHQVGPFDKTLKFLNIPIYKHFYNIWKEKYCILGLDILKYKLRDNTVSKYICGIKISEQEKVKPEIKNYFTYIKNRLNKNCKFVYILNEHLGETFLLASMLEQLLERDNIKKVTFVVQSNTQKEVLKLFADKSKIESIIVVPTNNNMRINTSLYIGAVRNIDGIFYRVLMPERFWRTPEVKDNHYLELICKELKLNQSSMKILPNVNANSVEKMIDKAKNQGLNTDNFIYLLPESTSVKEIPESFWYELSKKLRELGYDIYINRVTKNYKIDNTTSFGTSIEEAYILAQKAKYIIGMRSGLYEILISSKSIPAICIYNGDNRIKRNSMKKIEKLNYENLDEYDFNEEKSILNKIIEKIG